MLLHMRKYWLIPRAKNKDKLIECNALEGFILKRLRISLHKRG